ncbi:hypothetical protein [Stieleria mannarensis]|uniref:hypothetical protein n=1 Tax=Stieleria mannarensis TaxID=2755585 RepID=UPI0016043220
MDDSQIAHLSLPPIEVFLPKSSISLPSHLNNNIRGGARKLWQFNLNPDGSVDTAIPRLIDDWGQRRGRMALSSIP